jgi:hypothetical protein
MAGANRVLVDRKPDAASRLIFVDEFAAPENGAKHENRVYIILYQKAFQTLSLY